MSEHERVLILGCGNMGGALARSLSRSSLVGAGNVIVYDPDQHKVRELVDEFNVRAADVLEEAVSGVSIIIVAVKPNVVGEVLRHLRKSSSADQSLVVSVAAGMSLAVLSRELGRQEGLARAMPNLPCVVSQGASGVYAANPDDARRVARLFGEMGAAIVLSEESMLDAVTAVSGSGPGFVSAMIEAFAEGGIREGLSREDAEVLALHTFFGTSRLLIERGLSAEELKSRTATPGGTTEAGLLVLENRDLRGTLAAAVSAAAARSREIS